MKNVWSFEKNEDGTVCITDYKGEDYDIVIPDQIGANKVTQIAAYAFSPEKPRRAKQRRWFLEQIRSITIPDGVTSIGAYAFAGCKGLSHLVLPTGICYIESGTFKKCEGLSKIDIPEGVISIGASAFEGCFAVCINLPDSVTCLGNSAFADCLVLENIRIPHGITKIPDFAFSACASLVNILIPDGVTSVGDYAFDGCLKLEKITIPESVTYIGMSAFADAESAFIHKDTPTLFLHEGSFAQQYAKENDLPFVVI